MAYIGVQPQDTFISIDKQTFSTSATATYTLDHTVGSVNDIALFLNNVRQEPTTAYTISGTTLTLASAITSSDSMYCIYLGKSIGTQAPATGSVTNAMLAGSIATSKLTDGSTFATTNGITMANAWRVTASFAQTSGQVDITSNWEICDTDNYSSIGSDMSESSGIFTFPSTGIYLITYRNQGRSEGAARARLGGRIKVTQDNSSYATASLAFSSGSGHLSNFCTFQQIILDVSSTTNIKVKFTSEVDGSAFFDNETGLTYNGVTFLRLGDT